MDTQQTGKAPEGPWSHPFKFGKPESSGPGLRKRAGELLDEIGSSGYGGKGKKPQHQRNILMDRVIHNAKRRFPAAAINPMRAADMGKSVALTLNFRVPWNWKFPSAENEIRKWASEDLGEEVIAGCRTKQTMRGGKYRTDSGIDSPDQRVYDVEVALVVPPSAKIHAYRGDSPAPAGERPPAAEKKPSRDVMGLSGAAI